jgi:hypothetical protein
MHLYFLLTVLLAGAATAVGGATNTVKATEEIAYKATVAKGSISGKIPKGSVLDVVSEEGENLTVRFRQFTTTVPKQSTDYFVPRGDLHTGNEEGSSRSNYYPAVVFDEFTVSVKPFQAPQWVFTKDELNNAYYSARNSIKSVLKAPSTAEFSSPLLDPEGTGAKADTAGRIVCKGTVDAQNSFGVPLRQKWVVWVQPKGSDQWGVVYAVLNEKVLLDDREQYKPDRTACAEQFIGMSRDAMLRLIGEPVEVAEESDLEIKSSKRYYFSKEKDKETFFTVLDFDGKISSGMYQGIWFY